eukprot:NODE_106_length_19060_cov_0.700227.p20 type:complete len:103 gc:universal NODE_106_length_19060_cov_0.700227:9772-10080(+)
MLMTFLAIITSPFFTKLTTPPLPCPSSLTSLKSWCCKGVAEVDKLVKALLMLSIGCAAFSSTEDDSKLIFSFLDFLNLGWLLIFEKGVSVRFIIANLKINKK